MSEHERMNTSLTEELRYMQNKKTVELLPVIIMMAVFGFIGILGNIITIKFYTAKRHKSPTIILIISLAIVDLIVCIMFVPIIVELCVNMMYTSAIACKTIHFLCHWCLESSGLILGCIACDRYRKICGSSQKYMTNKFALRSVVTIVIFSCLMSVRNFVNIDIVSVSLDMSENSSSPLGNYCTTSDDPKLKLSVLIFHVSDAVVMLIMLGTIVFSYSNILWKVCKLKKVQSVDRRDHGKPNENKDVSEMRNINVYPHVITTDVHNDIMLEQSSVSRNTNELASNTTTKRQKNTLSGQKKIRRSEWNITMLMLAVTLGGLLCFFPYFIVKIDLLSVKRVSDLELGLLTQFGLRLMYINSVLNPLIYCLFNPSFRRHVKRLFSCKQEHE